MRFKFFGGSLSLARKRGVWVSFIAVIASLAFVGSAGAAPLPLTNDIAPIPSSETSALRSQGAASFTPFTGDGFTLMDSALADQPSYTLRLVANGQNVEALRSVVQAAAIDVAAATGTAIHVAPGTVPDTVPDREPAEGEILLSVDDTSPCGAGFVGCGGPRLIVTRPSDHKNLVLGGRIWVYTPVLGYTPEQKSHLVEHELGHALGLDHHDAPHGGAIQVMHSSSYDASTYRSGDRNGLAQLNATPLDLPRVAFADAGSNAITDWAFNLTSGWQQTFREGHVVAPGTSPSAVMAEHVPHMFFVNQTNNNTITDLNWTSNGWQQTPLFGHPVAPGTSPTAVVVDGKPHVYFVDAANNNTITEWAWTSNGWQQTPLFGHRVAAGTRPAATVVNGRVRVYFVDASANNTITEWAWTSNGWQQTPLFGHRVAAGTSPSAFTFGGTPHVFFVDEPNNNTITEWTLISGAWQQVPFFGHRVAAGSSPSAAIVTGIPEVFFVDAANNNSISAWVWSSQNGWQQAFLFGHPVTAGSSPSVVMSAGTPHVYFSDASAQNTLVDWTWNPTTGWQQTFMFGHSLAAGTSPSGF